MKKKLGFTLIELLVVVSIITLLTTIVLGALSTARKNAQDTRTKDQLSQFRTAAAVYFGANNNTYGITVPGSGCDGSGVCDCFVGDMTNTVFYNSPFVNSSIYPNNSSAACIANDTEFAFAVSLVVPQGVNTYWCVDSQGNSKSRVGPVTTTSC